MKLRLKAGVIEKIMSDRRLETDEQTALELMRAGAPISRAMALHIATIQGTNFDLSPWVEWVKPELNAPAA